MYLHHEEDQNQQPSERSVVWLLIPFVVLKVLLLLEPQITTFLAWISNLTLSGP